MARFNLKDFLRPNTRQLKLRSDVYPVKKIPMNDEKNLDLNTTARMNERVIEKSSPYYINSTFMMIIADLEHPLQPFDEQKEKALAKKA